MTAFYDYENARSLFRKMLAADPAHDIFVAAKEKPLREFYDWLWKFIPEALRDSPQLRGSPEESFLTNMMARIQTEWQWLDADRPYVNVFPVMEGILDRVKLDIEWSEVSWPYTAMLFRFATDEVEWNWETALIGCVDDAIQPSHEDRERVNASGRFPMEFRERGKRWVSGWIRPTIRPLEAWDISVLADPGEATVQATIDRLEGEHEGRENALMARLAKLAVFTALVWQDDELVSEHISQAMESKIHSRTAAERDAIIRKHAKQNGWGFDLGKRLQSEKNISPHWRMPHYALYHTGVGRMVPQMIKRKGATVRSKHGMDIPTGFLGPETEEEKMLTGFVFTRFPIPPSMRFEVMRRDQYRCCLCGRNAADGVMLEIDHKDPVAKGGPNTKENLWVLCFDCNRGKGTSAL